MGTDAIPKTSSWLYYAFYTLVENPNMFSDMETLLRIEEVHRETFKVEFSQIKDFGDYNFNFQ